MKRNIILLLLFSISATSFSYLAILLIQRNKQITLPVEYNSNHKVFSPTILEIPDQNINLPIYTSTIKNGIWEYVDDGVSYLDLSPVPGETGNSIIYGHNWNNILGKVKKAKINDKIIVHYSNGTTKSFKINDIFVVTPDQTHILSPSDNKKLTIYTCTGFLDSKRLVLTAELI